MEYSIGIDLGGRRIKFVTIDAEGRIIDRQALAITDNVASWSGKIKELVDSTIGQRQQPGFIGLAAPGLAAKDNRSIAFMPGSMLSPRRRIAVHSNVRASARPGLDPKAPSGRRMNQSPIWKSLPCAFRSSDAEAPAPVCSI